MGLIATSTVGSGSSSQSTSNAISSVNSMMSAASAVGQNYPTQVSLPSWLTTNPDKLQGELLDTYGKAPQSILDAADEAGKVANTSADQAYGQAMRQGGNATRQLTNSARQQGGTGNTSSIVAGQMAEDANKQKTDARVQIAQMKMQATGQAASLSSQIAQSLASLRSSYLGTLAGVNSTLRGQDMSLTQSTASLMATKDAQNTAADAAAAAKAPAAPTMSYTGIQGAGMGVYGGPTLQTIYPGWGRG